MIQCDLIHRVSNKYLLHRNVQKAAKPDIVGLGDQRNDANNKLIPAEILHHFCFGCKHLQALESLASRFPQHIFRQIDRTFPVHLVGCKTFFFVFILGKRVDDSRNGEQICNKNFFSQKITKK